MRKIVIAVMGTLSTLVLVVSFDASRREGDEGALPSAASDDQQDTASDDQQDTASDDQQDTASDDQQDTTSSPARGNKEPSGTFVGDEVRTRWGIVQVRITVKNGRITRATAIQYPQENHHDLKINSWAIPQLQQMTVQNQGQVDSLSGATVTSDGYRESLQSALDDAHL